MLSISERPLLIGVLYAPHPGHGHEARSSVFSRVHESWVRLMAQYLPAVPVLLGDMNLPSFLSPNPSPGLAASESALNGLFHASFILQPWRCCLESTCASHPHPWGHPRLGHGV